jgi:hypothetical protein
MEAAFDDREASLLRNKVELEKVEVVGVGGNQVNPDTGVAGKDCVD